MGEFVGAATDEMGQQRGRDAGEDPDRHDGDHAAREASVGFITLQVLPEALPARG